MNPTLATEMEAVMDAVDSVDDGKGDEKEYTNALLGSRQASPTSDNGALRISY